MPAGRAMRGDRSATVCICSDKAGPAWVGGAGRLVAVESVDQNGALSLPCIFQPLLIPSRCITVTGVNSVRPGGLCRAGTDDTVKNNLRCQQGGKGSR